MDELGDLAKAAAVRDAVVAPPMAATLAASIRNEPEAEAGTLRVVMGGQPYTLPTLKIEQGEGWQKVVAGEVETLDDGLGGDAENITAVLGRGTVAEMRLVMAYDHASHSDRKGAIPKTCPKCALGGEKNAKAKFDQRELFVATETILEAEFPFDEAGRRSVVKVFGLPLRALGIVVEAAEAEVSRSAKSLSSPLPIGASVTQTSGSNGRASNLSSDGDMVKSVSKKRSKRG